MNDAWTYSQRSGALSDPLGLIVEHGYSGSEPAINRPVAEGIENVGPIPTGSYQIGPARDDEQMGPCCLPLEPDPANEMHSRYGFYVHGDSDPAGNASSGCIIMSRSTRDAIAASTVKQLVVTT